MNYLVLGFGKSGRAAFKLLRDKQETAFFTDENKSVQAEYRSNPFFVSPEEALQALRIFNAIVVSPGLPKTHRILVRAKTSRIPIIGETELASRYFAGRIAAITGTDGKTTTTTLLCKILEKGNVPHFCGGNIGTPFSAAISENKKTGLAILEISSFQGRDLASFRPYIGIFLNFSEDHLRTIRNKTLPVANHKNRKEYLAGKYRIFKNQKKEDFAILNFRQKETRAVPTRGRKLFFSLEFLPKHYDGVFIKNGFVVARLNQKETKLLPLDAVHLPGKHNLENIMAAALAAHLLGVSNRAIQQAISSVKKLDHRIEFVRKTKKVAFYNDSKSTTVQALSAALHALQPGGKGVLIAGGVDKGGNFRSIRPLLKKNLVAAVLIGKDKNKIKNSWSGTIPIYSEKTLQKAVQKAYKIATDTPLAGKTIIWILLSPACASFDMFKDYQDRGEQFKKLVRQL